MTRILIIDDEPIYHKMVAHAIRPLGYDLDTAQDGEAGVNAARLIPPDLIICDVNMPKMSGYDVVRRLRRDLRFASTPIIILTAQSELEEKLEAFKAGADDHITKPFAPEELVARIDILLRKSRALKTAAPEETPQLGAHLVAVHSLRGGVGCSSTAVNLAVGLRGLSGASTIALDLVLNAGQLALLMNASQKRTWADITHIRPDELEMETLQSIIGRHDSGVHFIAGPTYPSEAELLTPDLFAAALKLLRAKYDTIVADLSHDFTEINVQFLDAANDIVVLLSPEMASLRAAVAALDTYNKLGYPPERIHLALNWTFERRGLARKHIESALHRPIETIFPFAPDLFVEAINYGQPVLFQKPGEGLSQLFEDLALKVSRPELRNSEPTTPTPAWKRAIRRLAG